MSIVAEARGTDLAGLAAIIAGEEAKTASSKYDDWAANGYDSRKEWELEDRMAASEAREKQREARAQQEARSKIEDERIEKQSRNVASKLKAETGWDVPPRKVAAAIKAFPQFKDDPIKAVKAFDPDGFAAHTVSVKAKVKKGPEHHGDGNRSSERAVPKSGSFSDMYDHIRQTS
jgi:hypothetical protein